MGRKSLVDTVADDLLDQIVTGELAVGAALPSEAEVGLAHDVSRVTVREAIKSLQARGVVRVENGKGSYVNPVSEWTSLDAVLRHSSAGTSAADAAVQLVEVRCLFEAGAASLAAARRTDADLSALEHHLADMQAAHEVNDVDRFVAADLAFHEVILKSTGNVFVGTMFEPLSRILAENRARTSRVPVIQQHALAEHRRVLDALTAADPDAARLAMEHHMQQTDADLRTYVLDHD